MNYETALSIVKYSAPVVTAAFAVIGVGVKTRDESGSLTRPGIVALVGIVSGTVLSLGSQYLESKVQSERAERAANAAAEQLAAQRKTIDAAMESLLSTRDATVSFSLHYPRDSLNTDGYFDRVSAIRQNPPGCERRPKPTSAIGGIVIRCKDFYASDEWQSGDYVLSFGEKSFLYPIRASEVASYAALERAAITAKFSPREPSPPFFGLASVNLRDFRKQAEYVLFPDHLTINVYAAPLPNDFFVNANIPSLTRVAGGKLEVEFSPPTCTDSSNQACEKFVRRLRDSVELGVFSIHFPHERDIDMAAHPGTNSNQKVLGPGHFVLSFPGRPEDFRVDTTRRTFERVLLGK